MKSYIKMNADTKTGSSEFHKHVNKVKRIEIPFFIHYIDNEQAYVPRDHGNKKNQDIEE